MTTPPLSACRAGQIRRSIPIRPGHQPRLFLLADPAGPADRFRVAHLLTPDTSMDTGTEQHLPANREAGRPYDLLVHEFPTYLDPIRLGPCLWAPAKSEYRPRYSDLASVSRNSDAPASDTTTPLTAGDARWRWKLAELDDANAHMVSLCCLFGECAQPHHPEAIGGH